MKIFYALSALFASAAAQQIEIVGATEAAAGTFFDRSQCTAHCSIEANYALEYAVIGTHYSSGSQGGETIAIKQQIVHPKNHPNTNAYEFAIYILASDSKQTPVQVSFDEVAANVPVIVRGFGATSEGGSEPNALLELTTNTLDNAKCANLLSGCAVDDTMICAGGQAGKDSCHGDSGGPLTIESNGQETLVGVVSWGIGCAEADKPSVYGRISAAKDFIAPYITNSPTVTPTPSTKPTPSTSKPSPTPSPSKTTVEPTTTCPTTPPPSPGSYCYYPDGGECLTDFTQSDCNYSVDYGTIWCGN
ncbi:unnamed protein product [Aphanomyces euteiches]|uniref:Peptidase S1 domain-containing protein n=1 Tax=Aphanomyces euteiches TaxID=100861 RepID=A0A6G0WA23_9STRA|nr:hypothetical protein Ae201684_017169 [Aphanomyces euteiches]KAH9078374.1 hypothetical protein Ae201684P_019464 [Aphanomyces euteiches]KAH9149150.1 hypothetical protein AeRB84_007677 [Aphanomyces euteiches]